MEAFEHVVRVGLESEGFAVSSNVKFPVRVKTRKEDRAEHQTHGYEIDLVGARGDRLVLASVKSFFGSKGVQLRSLQPTASKTYVDDPVVATVRLLKRSGLMGAGAWHRRQPRRLSKP